MNGTEWIVKGSVELDRGGKLKIEDGREMLVYVWKGKVWLTQERDRRDVVLRAGEWFRLDRNGVAVVTALAGCALTLTSPYEERQASAVEVYPRAARAPRTLYRPVH